MDNLKEYLPILIIALTFIISFVQSAGKKRKKDLNKTTLPEGVGDEKKYEYKDDHDEYDVWGDDLEEEIQYKKPVISEPIHKKSTIKPISEYKNISEIQTTILSENKDNVTALIDISDEEEVKRGIIYAEILKRKYI